MAIAFEKNRKLSYVQRQGRGKYLYFRHPFFRLSRGESRLPGPEGSPEFCAAYSRLLERVEQRTPRAEGERPERVTFKSGTVGWVAARYSGDYEVGLPTRKLGTRRAYLRALEILRDNLPADKRHGSNITHVPIAGMDREHVKAHCKLVQHKFRSQARADFQQLILSILFQYADDHLPECKLGRIANPARGRKRGYRAKPRLPLPPEVLQRALGDGCPPHLRRAINILFFTGQRCGDVCRMQWHDYKGDTLVIEEQEKTGARVELAVHRELRKVLMSAPRTCSFIVTTKAGREYGAANMLSKEIRARLIKIGQPAGKYTAHGLRKSAAVFLAERGATVKQLMDWFGWTNPKQAMYYVERANKAKLNKQTAALWDAA